MLPHHIGDRSDPWPAWLRSRSVRGTLSLIALTLCAALPLGVEYAHQWSLTAGLSAFPEPAAIGTASPVHRPAAHRAARPARHLAHASARAAHRAGAHSAHHEAAHATRTMRHASHRAEHARRNIARRSAHWKFDPRNNPYVSHKAPPIAHTAFLHSADWAVTNYLRAVIAGSSPIALAWLGLPASADPRNLSETPILRPGTHFTIVRVRQEAPALARVETRISAPSGTYREVFIVGPNRRIVYRFFD